MDVDETVLAAAPNPKRLRTVGRGDDDDEDKMFSIDWCKQYNILESIALNIPPPTPAAMSLICDISDYITKMMRYLEKLLLMDKLKNTLSKKQETYIIYIIYNFILNANIYAGNIDDEEVLKSFCTVYEEVHKLLINELIADNSNLVGFIESVSNNYITYNQSNRIEQMFFRIYTKSKNLRALLNTGENIYFKSLSVYYLSPVDLMSWNQNNELEFIELAYYEPSLILEIEDKILTDPIQQFDNAIAKLNNMFGSALQNAFPDLNNLAEARKLLAPAEQIVMQKITTHKDHITPLCTQYIAFMLSISDPIQKANERLTPIKAIKDAEQWWKSIVNYKHDFKKLHSDILASQPTYNIQNIQNTQIKPLEKIALEDITAYMKQEFEKVQSIIGNQNLYNAPLEYKMFILTTPELYKHPEVYQRPDYQQQWAVNRQQMLSAATQQPLLAHKPWLQSAMVVEPAYAGGKHKSQKQKNQKKYKSQKQKTQRKYKYQRKHKSIKYKSQKQKNRRKHESIKNKSRKYKSRIPKLSKAL